MFRKMASIVVLGFVAFCAGCTMCCHPYDYCGPVHGGCGQCGSNGRAGSILPGGPGPMQPMSVDGEQDGMDVTAADVKQESSTIGEYEGAKQILSVTDRKVEDQEVIAKTPPADNQSKPVLAQPAAIKRR